MNLTAPDGTVGWVDDAQVQAALKAGYRQATQEEVGRAKAAEQPIQAGLEGGARGVSMGLSDPLLVGYHKGRGHDPKEVLYRKEENPIASTTGEIAGMVGGAFLPGGPVKLVGEAGLAAKGVFAGKNTARLAQGAVEGGLWGLGQAISEDSLQDRELTGENLAAGVFGGALAGGAGNVVFGKVGDVGRSALVKAFGGGALKETLEDLAAQSTMRSITQQGDLSKGYLAKRSPGIGKFAHEEGFVKGVPSAATAAERASARAGVAKGEIDDAIMQIDQRVAFEPTNVYSRAVAEILDPIRNNAAKADAFEKVSGYLDRMLDPDPAKRMNTFRSAWETMSAMGDATKKDPNLKTSAAELFRLRGIVQDEVFIQAGAVFPDWEVMLRRANDDFGKASKFSELASKTAKRQSQNNRASLTDYAVGTAAGHLGLSTFGPAGGLVGVAAAGANKLMRERGGFVLGSALHSLGNAKVVNRLANSLAKSMAAKMAVDATFGGTFRTLLQNAAARGAMELLGTHVGLAQTDPTYLTTMGLKDEEPQTVSGYADKAHRLGNLENSNETMLAGIDKAINRMVSSDPAKAPSDTKALTRPEYEKMVKKLRELSMNGDFLKNQIAEIAPVTSGMASIAVLKGVQFLLDKAPKDPNENLPPALHRPWAPTRSDLAQWNRYVRAVRNPASVFQDIESGTVTPEGTEALRTIYPRLFKEFRDRMMARLGDLKEPLDRKKRAQVQVLLGDLDDPAQVALIQAMHARNKPSQPQKPDGREKVDVQRNLMTQGQRLANKEQG